MPKHGVCSECQSVQLVRKLPTPLGEDEESHYALIGHRTAGAGAWCGGAGTVPEVLVKNADGGK